MLDQLTVTAARGSGPVTIMEGETFLVANAEVDDEVKENEDPNYSDSVSAADNDASAFASLRPRSSSPATGSRSPASASITATDNGGGGDASAFVTGGSS